MRRFTIRFVNPITRRLYAVDGNRYFRAFDLDTYELLAHMPTNGSPENPGGGRAGVVAVDEATNRVYIGGLDGQMIFDGATNQQLANFLNNLVGLRDALASGNVSAVKNTAPALETSENNLVNLLSGRGALQQRLDIEARQNHARYSDLAVQVSRDADADLAQTIVELTQQQNAYQAALMSAGRILDHSLLDYV